MVPAPAPAPVVVVNRVPAPRTQPSHLLPRQADEQKHTPMLQRTFRRSAQLAPQAAGAISRHTSDRDAHGDAGARDRPPLDETDVASCVVDERVAADAAMCRCVPVRVESRPKSRWQRHYMMVGAGLALVGAPSRCVNTARKRAQHALPLAGCRVTYDGQHVWTSRRCPRRPSRVAAGW